MLVFRSVPIESIWERRQPANERVCPTVSHTHSFMPFPFDHLRLYHVLPGQGCCMLRSTHRLTRFGIGPARVEEHTRHPMWTRNLADLLCHLPAEEQTLCVCLLLLRMGSLEDITVIDRNFQRFGDTFPSARCRMTCQAGSA